LGEKTAERLNLAMQKLALEPRPHGCIKMQGNKDQHRIKVGEFRIVYDVDDGVRIIDIIKLGDRKDIYRD
jgi:mRNA interferase RelE/StbE